MISIMMTILFINHLMTCIYFFLGSFNGIIESWAGPAGADLQDTPVDMQYIITFYWAF